jgi:DNA polymerase-1
VPDFIALRGDASDRIPGARGVGAVGAAALLRSHGSLDKAIAAGRFPTQAETLRLYRRIATMDASAPLPILRRQTPQWARAADMARQWGLDNLATRLTALAAAGGRGVR